MSKMHPDVALGILILLAGLGIGGCNFLIIVAEKVGR